MFTTSEGTRVRVLGQAFSFSRTIRGNENVQDPVLSIAQKMILGWIVRFVLTDEGSKPLTAVIAKELLSALEQEPWGSYLHSKYLISLRGYSPNDGVVWLNKEKIRWKRNGARGYAIAVLCGSPDGVKEYLSLTE